MGIARQRKISGEAAPPNDGKKRTPKARRIRTKEARLVYTPHPSKLAPNELGPDKRKFLCNRDGSVLEELPGRTVKVLDLDVIRRVHSALGLKFHNTPERAT